LIGKWLLIATAIGVLVGSASAAFLLLLDEATSYRENNLWIIALLPLAGLAIGLVYHYWGQSVVKGTNQLLEECYTPTKKLPIQMAPLIFVTTIITHLFGGSAGREGTAVQMGGAIADQLTGWFKFSSTERKTLLLIGISAGFAAVFGTPLTGVVFALELVLVGQLAYKAIIPSLISAYVAHYICLAWSVTHTQYVIAEVPDISLTTLGWAGLAGAFFGLVAILFTKSNMIWTTVFDNYIRYAPLRPFIGGIVIAIAVWLLGTTKYIGLGVPTIVESFTTNLPPYDFIVKILFTTCTLGAGFKGGEATPLFFIGATLGNALIWFIPLPIGLLAGMGFVALFAGTTKTPIACIVMGIELFGIESILYIAIACVVSYLLSGKDGIYSSQRDNRSKYLFALRFKTST
jgi:H+/Cl- antiporter ClcA